MVINTPKKYGYYTFTTIKPWLIFLYSKYRSNNPWYALLYYANNVVHITCGLYY